MAPLESFFKWLRENYGASQLTPEAIVQRSKTSLLAHSMACRHRFFPYEIRYGYPRLCHAILVILAKDALSGKDLIRHYQKGAENLGKWYAHVTLKYKEHFQRKEKEEDAGWLEPFLPGYEWSVCG